jgi:hypothetical protein
MKTAVLVMCHDRYISAWEPCWYSLKKYWADCPYDIFFMFHGKHIPPSRNIIIIGEDRGWGNSMKIALNELRENGFDQVIVMCEDYWLTREWNTKGIVDICNWLEYYNLHHIRLITSSERAEDYKHNNNLCYFQKQALYITSMSLGLWNIEALDNLIKDTDTIWQFETEGRLRIEDSNLFLSVKEWKYVYFVHPDDPYFKCTNGAIEQGKYMQSAYDWANIENYILCSL